MNVLIQPAISRKLRRRNLPSKALPVIQVLASVDGQSLPDLVRHFSTQDAQGKKAMASAIGADVVHPMLLKRFRKALKAAGFSPKLIVCTGYIGPLDSSMPSGVRSSGAMTISHAVVVVGNLVVDLCFKRMGEKYDLPQTYPERRLSERWRHMQDVSRFADITSEDVIRMQHLTKTDPTFDPRHVELAFV